MSSLATAIRDQRDCRVFDHSYFVEQKIGKSTCPAAPGHAWRMPAKRAEFLTTAADSAIGTVLDALFATAASDCGRDEMPRRSGEAIKGDRESMS